MHGDTFAFAVAIRCKNELLWYLQDKHGQPQHNFTFGRKQQLNPLEAFWLSANWESRTSSFRQSNMLNLCQRDSCEGMNMLNLRSQHQSYDPGNPGNYYGEVAPHSIQPRATHVSAFRQPEMDFQSIIKAHSTYSVSALSVSWNSCDNTHTECILSLSHTHTIAGTGLCFSPGLSLFPSILDCRTKWISSSSWFWLLCCC